MMEDASPTNPFLDPIGETGIPKDYEGVLTPDALKNDESHGSRDKRLFLVHSYGYGHPWIGVRVHSHWPAWGYSVYYG